MLALQGSLSPLASPALQGAIRLPQQTYRTLMMLANPTAYYRLGENSGIVAVDEVGNFNASYMPNNGTDWTGGFLGADGALAGDSGKSAFFASTNSLGGRIEGPSTNVLSAANFTVEFWAYRTANRAGARVVYRRTGNQGWLFALDTTNGDTIRFLIGTGAGLPNILDTTPMPVGVWVHFAGTYDGTTARLYRNGVQTNSLTTAYSTVDAPFFIASEASSDTNAWKGGIDEVAIYNRALTAEEILSHATWKSNGSTSALEIEGLVQWLDAETGILNQAGLPALEGELIYTATAKVGQNAMPTNGIAQPTLAQRSGYQKAIRLISGKGLGIPHHDALYTNEQTIFLVYAVDGQSQSGAFKHLISKGNAANGGSTIAVQVAGLTQNLSLRVDTPEGFNQGMQIPNGADGNPHVLCIRYGNGQRKAQLDNGNPIVLPMMGTEFRNTLPLRITNTTTICDVYAVLVINRILSDAEVAAVTDSLYRRHIQRPMLIAGSVNNGNFETTAGALPGDVVTGWSDSVKGTADDALKAVIVAGESGANAVRITVDGAGQGTILRCYPLGSMAKVGKRVRITLRAKADVPCALSLSDSAMLPALTTAWQTISADVTLSRVGIYLKRQGGTTNRLIDIDNVTLEEVVRRPLNLMRRSQELNLSPWVLANVTSNPNSQLSPDSTLTAEAISYPIDTSGLVQDVKIAGGQVHTWSVWLKGSVGGEVLRMQVEGLSTQTVDGTSASGNGAGYGLFPKTLTTEWVRHSVTFTSYTNKVNTRFNLRYLSADNGGMPITVYAWGSQLEPGATANTYVPTGAEPAISEF